MLILDCRVMLAATKVLLPASSDHVCTFTTFNNGRVSRDNVSTSMDPVDDRRSNQFNVGDGRAQTGPLAATVWSMTSTAECFPDGPQVKQPKQGAYFSAPLRVHNFH